MSALRAAEAAANAALKSAIALTATDARAACAALERLAQHFPNQPAILVSLAAAQALSGAPGDAARTLEAVLAIAPHDADALNNLAVLRRAERRFDEAMALFHRAHAARPFDGGATGNLIAALRIQRRHSEAMALAQAWCNARPQDANAWQAMAETLIHKRRGPAAVSAAMRLGGLRPTALAQAILARALECDGQYQRALDVAREAFAADKDDPSVACALIEALISMGALDEADARLDALARAQPDLDLRILRARTLLLKAPCLAAWTAYEHRFEIDFLRLPTLQKPRWRGEPVAGKRILLIGEQGVGDTVQFARAAWEIAARGGEAILHLSADLAPLFTTLPRGVTFAPTVSDGGFDLWAPLLSAPLALRAPMAGPSAPYVHAPAGRAAPSAMSGAGLKVGLVWAGAPGHPQDYLRSARLADFAPLLAQGDVAFFALQKGEAAGQIARDWMGPLITDLGPSLNDWGDTAAALSALDLLITVDTSIAHVAGAMGKPVWTLLQFAPDWRWGSSLSAAIAPTPWYPTMRLFRQSTPRCWRAPIAAMATLLDALRQSPRREPMM